METKKEINNKKITIVGTGAFGTAIAQNLVLINKEVILYGIDQKEIIDINKNHRNSKYFSKHLSKKIKATDDPIIAFKDSEIIIMGLPSHVMEPVLRKVIIPQMNKKAYFINLSKGFDYLNDRLLHKLIKDTVPEEFFIDVLKLSGPSFAIDLVYKQPTQFVLACQNIEVADLLANIFRSKNVKVLPHNDIVGTELVSIVKNPYAVLLGIVAGLGYKENAQALIFTQVLKEITMLMKIFNKNKTDIIYTPAGIGDLYLTGSSKKSRNYSTGFRIGSANKVTKKILSTFTTVEGLRSIEVIRKANLDQSYDPELFALLYEIVINKQQPSKIIGNYFEGIKL